MCIGELFENGSHLVSDDLTGPASLQSAGALNLTDIDRPVEEIHSQTHAQLALTKRVFYEISYMIWDCQRGLL